MLIAAALNCQAALAGLAVLAAPTAKRRWARGAVYGGCALAAAGSLALALTALTQGGAEEMTLPIGLPWQGMQFRLDALAAVFLAIVNLGGVAAALFAIGYGQHETAPERVLPFVPAFLAAMNLVILSADAFSFLLSWECMSLLSWALVVSHDRAPENLRAGLIYVVMAGLGTLTLLLCFSFLAGQGLAGPGGDFGFAAMRAHGASSATAALVLALALIGAGSKAGLFPLHVWLPLAHPAAPAHVSGLMSGVMTKVAIYAFIRIVFDLMGPTDWSFGLIVMAVGAVTAVLGVLYALMQNDLKRLLAYSTVENIGIVFAALGMALVFRGLSLTAAAALAASAALFHAFNHSLFKSLLFFASGAVQNATGLRDLDRLGGLIRVMPQTALAFLFGAAAISALPPLNGFASEWMIFQAAFLSGALPQWGLRLAIPATAAVLALAAALAAASFAKAFGIGFLGRPRSAAAKTARETDALSRFVLLALAAGCVAAGVLPGAVVHLMAPAVQALAGAAMPAQPLAAPMLPTAACLNGYGGLAVAGLLAFAAVAILLLVRLLATCATRRADSWDCGHREDNPLSQYSAGSIAQPIRRIHAAAFAAKETVAMPPPCDPSPGRFAVRLGDPAWDFLCTPIAKTIGVLADRLNPFQYLTIRRYLSIAFVALVLLLTVLAIWP